MTTGRINQIALFSFFLSLLRSASFRPPNTRARVHRRRLHSHLHPLTRDARDAGSGQERVGGIWAARHFGWLVLSLFLSLSLSAKGRADPASSSSPSPSLNYPHGPPSAGISMPTRGTLTGYHRWAATATGPPIAPIGAVLGILRLTRSRLAPVRVHRCLWIRQFALILPVSEADRLRKLHLV